MDRLDEVLEPTEAMNPKESEEQAWNSHEDQIPVTVLCLEGNLMNINKRVNNCKIILLLFSRKKSNGRI